MWNAETVKELFVQLDAEWEYGCEDIQDFEYIECTGNFINFMDVVDSDGRNKLYISNMANPVEIPEDIVRMRFIYAFIILQHNIEVSRFIMCKNPDGLIEFLERTGRYICEKCGYTFHSHDDIHKITSGYSEKYIKEILASHTDAIAEIPINSGNKYKIEKIDGENIYLRSLTSDDIINMEELKSNGKDLPYMTVSF